MKGLWRHPRNQTAHYTDLEYWTNLAKTLEAGKFHGLFLADMLGIYDVYKGPGNIDPVLPGAAQFPISDPLQVEHMQDKSLHKNILTAVDSRLRPWLLLPRIYRLA